MQSSLALNNQALAVGRPDVKIGALSVGPGLWMAPMCDITYAPFRLMTRRFGAALVYTQMVSAKAISLGDAKSFEILKYTEAERPLGMQVFGYDADVLGEAAARMQDLGPDLLDLNMGCPAKKIVNDGGGSALLRDHELAEKIFKAMRRRLDRIPFTIKMRAGWDGDFEATLKLARIAEDCGVDAIALHARTRAQGYSGLANWDLISRLKQTVKIPVIGNGDVKSVDDARRMEAQTGCDAVMVGRGGLSRPWLFKQYFDHEFQRPTLDELCHLILGQYEGFTQAMGENRGIKTMRKLICSYTRGLRDGSSFRQHILRDTTLNDIQTRLVSFFSNTEYVDEIEVNHEDD